jgi:hypothetical protein
MVASAIERVKAHPRARERLLDPLLLLAYSRFPDFTAGGRSAETRNGENEEGRR